MIDILNEEINKFLFSYPNIEDEKLNQIQKKYSSSITDSLDKGHITTNICMIAASNLKQNPKDIATSLVEWLKKTKKFENLDASELQKKLYQQSFSENSIYKLIKG